MKKKIFFVLMMVALMVTILASCGASCEETGHTFEETVIKAATCTTAGSGTKKCSVCGVEEPMTIPPLKHKLDKNNPTRTVEPTCMENGATYAKCQNAGCDYEEKIATLDASLDYCDLEEKKTEPTCLGKGYTMKVCKVCGNDQDMQSIDPLGHTYTRENPTGITYKAPVCLTDGSITIKCLECDLEENVEEGEWTYSKLNDESLEIPEVVKAIAANYDLEPLEHIWDAKNETLSVAPTCTEPGYDMCNCSREGCTAEAVKTADYEPLKHTFERDGFDINNVAPEDRETIISPSCWNNNGKDVVLCSDCGVQSTEHFIDLPALEHYITYDASDVTAATCTEGSFEYRKCTGKGCQLEKEKFYTGVSALGHDMVLYDALLTGGEPTCKTLGNYPYHCSRCEAFDKDYQINLKGETQKDAPHMGYTAGQFTNTENGEKAPTCYEYGVYYCEDCKTTFTDKDDNACKPTGIHSYSSEYEGNEVVNPTCTEEGYTIYRCQQPGCQEFEHRDYVVRAAHTFDEVTKDGILVCTCGAQYINTTTIMKVEGETALPGVDGVTVAPNGTKYPDAPQAIGTTSKEFNFSAEDKNEDGVNDNLAYGLIELKGTADTVYTVKVYNADGECTTLKALASELKGETIYVDLYECDDVVKVEISATTDATVSFYYKKA